MWLKVVENRTILDLIFYKKQGLILKILLTNDDGYDSPLLAMVYECVKNWGEVSIVVPAAEQSWTGKSITRIGTMESKIIDYKGIHKPITVC